jgi:hypothetical protein
MRASGTTRRSVLQQGVAVSATVLLPQYAAAASKEKPRRLSLEEAREVGEARAAELEREKGPVLKTNGITYREEVRNKCKCG